MNSAEDMLGYYTGKGLAWKRPEPLGQGGQSGGGQSAETSCEGSPARDGTVCSETSAHKFQTPGNHPKKAYNIQYMAKV